MLIVETPHELPQISCSHSAIGEHARPEFNKPSSRKVCFSFAAYAKNVINHMRKCHIPIAEGLTDEEFSHIESTFGFTFPPDLEAILQEGLPEGEGFPHWRQGSHAEIRSWLDLPIKALCREVKRGRFWPSEWGVRPYRAVDAVQRTTNELKRVPTLVPVYANCYISCFPVQAGNPIFLVQQSTILYCGYDLADFFKRQAFVPRNRSTYGSQMPEPQCGLWLIKEQIKIQRNSLSGPTNGIRAMSGAYEGPVSGDEIGMSLSKATWRWADESPRIPIDAVACTQVNGSHHYQHVKTDVSALVTPSPLPPTLSPSLSSSSSSSSSPASSKTSPFVYKHMNSSSPSSSSSSSSGKGHDDQKVGKICKKYLYFHEKPLPSRMLNHFTMAAPPWVAKQARKITFWSDVAEGYWMQPEGSSGPNTPCNTPHLLQTVLDYATTQQHEKEECTLDHASKRNCNHQNDSAVHPQASAYPVPKQGHSYQQHINLDRNLDKHQLAKQGSQHPVVERKLDGVQYEETQSVKVSTEDFAFDQKTTSDQHDYVIHYQPADKWCRSNYPVLERKFDEEATSINFPPPQSPCYVSAIRAEHNNHELPLSNSQDVHLNSQPAERIMNGSAHSCEKHSDNTWLSDYLNGLADALRRGRWGEGDINDMLLQSTPDHANAARLNSCLQHAGGVS